MYQSFQLRRTKSKVTNRSYHNTSLRGCPVSPFTAIFIPPQHSALPPGALAATGLAEAVLQGRERSALSGSVFVSFTFEGQFCQVRGSGVTCFLLDFNSLSHCPRASEVPDGKAACCLTEAPSQATSCLPLTAFQVLSVFGFQQFVCNVSCSWSPSFFSLEFIELLDVYIPVFHQVK